MLGRDGATSEIATVSIDCLSNAATVVCNLKSDQHRSSDRRFARYTTGHFMDKQISVSRFWAVYYWP